jgi:hypothetical protein
MRHKRTAKLRYPGLRRGCIGDWAPFLGPTGPILFDRSGYGNHGILTRMDVATDWVPSGAGHALDFDGINDLVLIGSESNASPMFGAIDRGTMCTWVKIPTTGTGDSYRGIFSKEFYYGLFIINGTLSYFDWGGGGQISSNTSLSDGLWHHVSFTFSVSGPANMWLDGKKVITGGAINRNSVVGPLQIANNGAYSDVGNQCFKGQVDGSMIFNRILSEKEIQLLASRRGIAHEVVPSRRSIAQVSAAVSLNSNNLMMGTYL